MRILITYASNSGSTHLTSKIIKEVLEEGGYQVTHKKAKYTSPDEFYNYDLVLMGSPSWSVEGKEGMPHETVLNLMRSFNKRRLEDMEFALFGCGDSSYTYFCGAVDHLQEFVKSHGGSEVIDPLKIEGFFFKEEERAKEVEDWTNKLLDIINDATI